MTIINGCLFVWGLSSHSRIFHSYWDVTIASEGLHIFTYARHSWPLNSEGSLACSNYCNTYCDIFHLLTNCLLRKSNKKNHISLIRFFNLKRFFTMQSMILKICIVLVFRLETMNDIYIDMLTFTLKRHICNYYVLKCGLLSLRWRNVYICLSFCLHHLHFRSFQNTAEIFCVPTWTQWVNTIWFLFVTIHNLILGVVYLPTCKHSTRFS